MERAARAMFFAALRRSMRRQLGRAKDAAKAAAHSTDFLERVRAYQEDHHRYVADQIADVLRALGLEVDTEEMKAVLVPALGEEPWMLSDAYYDGLDGWCDIDARAGELAGELTEIVTKETA